MNKNETTNESSAIAIYSKEQGEQDQTRIATALGCDKEKKVSGMDYLVILLLILEEQGIADQSKRERALQVCAAMKANNSALRQYLYERPEAKAVSNKASKYLSLGQ